MGKPILVHLQHPRFQESLLVKAFPEPCMGEEIICLWLDEYKKGLELEKCRFLNFFVDDSPSLIFVQGQLGEINHLGLTVQLPDVGYAVGARRVKRYASRDIAVEITQNGFQARGALLDFSPLGFRVHVTPLPPYSFHAFSAENKVDAKIGNNESVFFSGTCRCLRHQIDFKGGEIVLTPFDKEISRFKKRHFRNKRHNLTPPPLITFHHPLMGKKVELEVSDISTSGFSVIEDIAFEVLMPGLIIPDLSIHFAGSLKMQFPAQVIHRKIESEKEIRYGIAILDMDMNTYSRYADIMINTAEEHTHLSGEVDLDELWEFFFSAGFFYPKKYNLIQGHSQNFKKTYQKLYQESPDIANYLTYQKRGRITGHISMIRLYEKAWLIHHHAARRGEMTRSGIHVLKRLMNFLHDGYRLPSSKMDYVVSYFRPNNKFPNRFFGDFTRSLNKRNACSLDLFSYLSFPTVSLYNRLPDPWSLERCSAIDLLYLDQFYRHHYGGLLLDAFSLNQESGNTNTLEKDFEMRGFYRKLEVYALKHQEELHAILVVNQSDLGINLSELTNSIQVLVTNPEGLSWDVLSMTIGRTAASYRKMRKVPVLVYPQEYLDLQGIDCERQYYLWILNVLYGEEFLEYIKERFGIIK